MSGFYQRRFSLRRPIRATQNPSVVLPQNLITQRGSTNVFLFDPESGVTESGGLVDEWISVVGGITLLPGANAPPWNASGGPNNLPYAGSFRDGGTSRGLSASAAGIQGNSSTIAMVVVARVGASNTQPIATRWGTGAAAHQFTLSPESPGAGQAQLFLGTNGSGGVAITDGQWAVFHIAGRNDSTGAAGDAESYLRCFAAEAAGASTRVIDNDPGTIELGDTTATSSFDGDICYAHGWRGPKLTAAERVTLNAYYLQRFGLTL